MAHNEQETKDAAAGAPRKDGRKKRDEGRKTRTYKHVNIDRTRPQLTKEGSPRSERGS